MRAQKRWYRGVLWSAAYLVMVLATQLGSLSREVINWDESTFMLLGQNLINGTLPFIDQFDNKPPMIFFIFAGWMALFGETVPSARLLGDACLWGNAVVVYAIARHYADPFAAGASGAIYIAMHAVDPGLHTTASAPALLCMLIALWLILRYRGNGAAIMLAGVFVSIAVMTRSNLAYMALASGIWFAVLGLVRPGPSRCSWRTPVAYGIGGMLPVLGIILLYAQAGAVAELKLASVDVALSYAGQWGMPGAVLGHVVKWTDAMQQTPFLHVPFTVLSIWSIILMLWPGRSRTGRIPRLTRYDWSIIWLFLLFSMISIAQSGAVYTYYWQQFFPFACLFIAWLLERLKTSRLRMAVLVLACISIGNAVVSTAAESLRVLREPSSVTAQYDIRNAATFLDRRLREDDRIWALDRHLIHVYLDQPVISPILAHPSNLTRLAIVTPLVERGYLEANMLRRIMDSYPEYLVSNAHDDLFYFRQRSTVDIRAYIRQNYVLIYENSTVRIWRHLNVKAGLR